MNSTSPSEALPSDAAADAGPAVLSVVHETAYRYHSPVELAQHIAVLQPRDDGAQQLLAFGLAIEPPPTRLRSDCDVYGNRRSLFALSSPHETLRVQASSRVRVGLRPLPAAMDLPWETARERWRYVSGQPLDAAAEFVFASPLVPLHAAVRDWARPSFTPRRPLVEAVTELMQRLHEDFAYAPDSTEVGTPLLAAFEQRRGVCQDFAHVMLSGLRGLGLAARYVSGYLLTEPAPGLPKLEGADASHAWVAVAVPREDGGCDWLELDPTNDCRPGLGHVRLAEGRDYADVTPLRGIIRGGSRHRLSVRVSTQRVA